MFRLTLALIMLSLSCSKMKPASSEFVAPDKTQFVVSEGISHPESVIYSPKHHTIFVSNIATGNPVETKKEAYISKISETGKMMQVKWISGLRAPKGMCVVGDFLYVSDVTYVVKIDILKAKIVAQKNIKDAKFLNDVACDAKGNVYISDMFDNAIYRWNKSGISLWLKNPSVRSPNGLLFNANNELVVAFWGSDIDPKTFMTKSLGAVATITDTQVVSESTSIQGHLDGIDFDSKGNLWVSDWMNGNVFKKDAAGKVEILFNFGQGTADISVAKELNLLLVPQMAQSKILAIKI